jgi:hypothetical protein
LFLGVVLGAFLAKTYGALGMITGTVTGWLIVQNVMNFYYHKVIGLNIFRFFKELAHKIIITVLIILSLGYLVNYVPGTGWINFIVKAICYSIMYVLLMYNFGLINFEKELFKSALAPVLKKFKV